MKKYTLMITLLCTACYVGPTYQDRIESYRHHCSNVYGYQTQDMTALCIQKMEEQYNAEQKEYQKSLERSQRQQDRKWEQREREKRAYEREYELKKLEYFKWEQLQEAELTKKAEEYRKKYPASTAESLISLDRASFNLEKTKRKPLM